MIPARRWSWRAIPTRQCSREHNQALSDARARAVADVLARQGVARDRIRTEGMGEEGLAVQTGEGVAEPRNRRVMVRLISGNTAEREAERGSGADPRYQDPRYQDPRYRSPLSGSQPARPN